MDLDAPTSLGPGRLVISPADDPIAVLWLGHGAGGGIGAADLAALAAALPSAGITVARYEQPWRVAGRRVAPRPAALDVAWLETAPLVAEVANGVPLVTGGRSAGARVACRTVQAIDAAAVVCLAFPLHPPGHPEKSRLAELLLPEVPVLVIQGERDSFGAAAVLAEEAGGKRDIRVVAVPGADHSMKVRASSLLTAADIATLVAATVGDFIREVAAAGRLPR